MRLVVLMCGLWLAAGGTVKFSDISMDPRALDPHADDQLTEWEIEVVCPAIQRRTTLEAGTMAAKLYLGSLEGVPDHELKSFGKDRILNCVRAACPEAISSFADAIALHDPNGTLEGMKKAISAIGIQMGHKLFQYTQRLTAMETADVVLDLYLRAQKVANMEHVSLRLTREGTRSIGVHSWLTFHKFL